MTTVVRTKALYSTAAPSGAYLPVTPTNAARLVGWRRTPGLPTCACGCATFPVCSTVKRWRTTLAGTLVDCSHFPCSYLCWFNIQAYYVASNAGLRRCHAALTATAAHIQTGRLSPCRRRVTVLGRHACATLPLPIRLYSLLLQIPLLFAVRSRRRLRCVGDSGDIAINRFYPVCGARRDFHGVLRRRCAHTTHFATPATRARYGVIRLLFFLPDRPKRLLTLRLLVS